MEPETEWEFEVSIGVQYCPLIGDFSRRTLLARQLTKSTVLSAQISTLDTSADLPSAYFPRRST
jgi:hypothetical protein